MSLLEIEEIPNDIHLEPGHCNDGDALRNGEPENAVFRGHHRAKIAVFACTEVLLGAGDVGQRAREAEKGLLHETEGFRLLYARLFDSYGTSFVFDRNFEIDKLFCKCGHVIGEAE